MPALSTIFPRGDITILDDFNRADGAVYAGAGASLWQTIRRDGAASNLVVSGNKLGTNSTGEQGGATTETVTDFIRILTISAIGTSPNFYFGFRLSNLGSANNGYFWTLTGGAWTLYTIVGGVYTSLGGTSGSGMSSGFKIAFRSIGNVHEVWVNGSGSPAWPSTPTATVTDPASLYTSGCISLEPASAGWAFENYSSASNAVPTTPVTLIVDPDHSAASDLHNRTQASNPSTPLASIETAAYLARATPTWADDILIKRSVTSNLGDPYDPHVYPSLSHYLSYSVTPWPFADNMGNQTIVMRGDTSASTGNFDNLPKLGPFHHRFLKNWTIQDLQFGYEISSPDERSAGTGHDYLTWANVWKCEDIKYERCLFTGGAAIVGNWAGDFIIHQCRTHAPLSPGQFGVGDGEGWGFSGQASDGSADIAHGHIIISESEFSNIRGNDALRMDGCLPDGLTWDDDFDLHVTNCTFQNVCEQNFVYHCDSIQVVSIPRATITNNVFIGCTDCLMMVDGHHGTIRFENNLISGPVSPTPLQAAGFDHLIVRHNTFDEKFTTPQDASIGLTSRYIGADMLFTCINNILGGFYFSNSSMAVYFNPASVIESNLILTHPGWVTPYGTNLAGLPEFGTSSRLNGIPIDVVVVAEQTTGEINGTIERTWELSNTPVSSPGIGQGQVTDITTDHFGRAYTSPPDVGCFQSIPGTLVTAIPRAPYMLSNSPVGTGVVNSADVVATLYPLAGQHVDATTVSGTSFSLKDPANNVIPGTISVDEGTNVLTLDVDGLLYPLVVYTVRLTTAIADSQGSHLAQDIVWTFRVAGSGGPAVITDGSFEMAEKVTNDYATLSAAGMLITGSTLMVVDPPPAELLGGNFRIRIENPDPDGNPSGNNVEFLNVITVDTLGTTWTVVRQAENSARFPQVAHAAGSIVTHVFTVAALMGAISAGGGNGAGTLIALGNQSGPVSVPTGGDSEVVARGMTLIGNSQITLTGLVTGQIQNIDITGKQDATGGRTLSLNDGSGAVAVPIPAGANAAFQISALWDGTDLWVDLVGGGSGGGGGGGAGLRFEQDVATITSSRPYHLVEATTFTQARVTVDTPVGANVNLVNLLVNGTVVATLALTSGQSTALLSLSVTGNDGDAVAITRLSVAGGGLVVELLET